MVWTTALLLLLGIAACGRADGHHIKGQSVGAVGNVNNGVAGNSFLTNLGNYVKAHSDPDVPPQQDVSTPVQVHFTYAIGNIADVDKEHNTVTTETYIRANWNTSITWDPNDFGGADMITLPRKYFWTPRMQSIHTAVEVRDLSPQMVMLKSDGTAYYNQFYRLGGLCDVSHVESGASCNSRNALWGYSKDQVTIADVVGDKTGNIRYFAGSKYEIIGFGMKFNEIEFNNKVYQIVDTVVSIKEKPRDGHGPVNLHFKWH